jgi:hypothetical protein
MNAASIKSSKRLQRVDSLLSDFVPRSTMQIIQEASVCAVNSIIAELRANGRTIKCHRHEGIYYYRRLS